MSNVNTKNNVRTIAVTGMLSAVAVVLMYLEIPIPIMPGFIKFDFSDLPALLGAYALGPVAGIIICFIKNVVHLAASQSMLVGELSNFILGSVFVFTAGIVYKKKKSKTGALLGGLCGAMAMGVFSVFSNYLIVYPVYYKLAMPEVVILSLYQAIIPSMKSIMQCLICFNLPFTIVKGLIDVGISMLIYKPLSEIGKTVQELHHRYQCLYISHYHHFLRENINIIIYNTNMPELLLSLKFWHIFLFLTDTESYEVDTQCIFRESILMIICEKCTKII